MVDWFFSRILIITAARRNDSITCIQCHFYEDYRSWYSSSRYAAPQPQSPIGKSAQQHTHLRVSEYFPLLLPSVDRQAKANSDVHLLLKPSEGLLMSRPPCGPGLACSASFILSLKCNFYKRLTFNHQDSIEV